LSFAPFDADDHSAAIDMAESEGNGFGEPQASGIADGQNGAIFALGYATEKLLDLLGAEDDALSVSFTK
jgi:hypothetical protein